MYCVLLDPVAVFVEVLLALMELATLIEHVVHAVLLSALLEPMVVRLGAVE